MHIKEIKQRIIDRGLVQSKYSHHICFALERSTIRPNIDTKEVCHVGSCISFSSFHLSVSAKSSLEAVMYREVRTKSVSFVQYINHHHHFTPVNCYCQYLR